MNYAQLGAIALAKCAAYDPYLPEPTAAQAGAWGELLERYRIDDQRLVLDAVAKMYAEHNSGFRPLPKDLVDAARAIRREEDAKRGPSEDYEALCDAKSGERRRAIESFVGHFPNGRTV